MKNNHIVKNNYDNKNKYDAIIIGAGPSGASSAKTFVENEFDNTKSAQRLFANYLEVIEHFRNGKEIDKNKHFSTEKFHV